MDRFRLKNCIILILVLMNLFLLTSLVTQESANYTARRASVEQLVALFAADGITLAPDTISTQTPPAGRTLKRSDELERQAAAALLGTDLSRSEQGGGISTYSSSRGAAIFRSTGSFEAAGTLASNGLDFCRSFCKEFGYEAPVFQLDESRSGIATVKRIYDKYPIFNCTVSFSLSEGVLTGVSGVLLPVTFTETTSETPPLSAAAALTAFQKLRRDTQAVVSAVTEMSLCFELQSTAAAPMALVPSWRITADTATYYVNCTTGAVTVP